MKTCNKCGETKELSEFGKRKYSRDGYHYLCRVCSKADSYARYLSTCVERYKRQRAYIVEQLERAQKQLADLDTRAESLRRRGGLL
jgi:hypothetical protein